MKRTKTNKGSKQAKRRKMNDGSAVLTLDKKEVKRIKTIINSKSKKGVRVRWSFLDLQEQQSIKSALAGGDAVDMDEVKSLFKATNASYRDYLALQRAAKASNQTPYVVAGNEDDNLVIMFMKIGSGDCIFIKTPKGNVIVVDCGSRARPTDDRPNYQQEIQDMLISPLFLNGDQNTLYALIITHPDKDHYNELLNIVTPKVSAIKHIFFTFKSIDYYEIQMDDVFTLGTYKNRVAIDWTQKEVTSDQIEHQKRYDMSQANRIQILGSDTVLGPAGTPFDGWNEPDCSIFLLAAEIPDTVPATPPAKGSATINADRGYYRGKLGKRTASENNSGSIVTLIEANGRKVLLVGDATYATEAFLMEKHAAKIKDVDLAQLEHHGSGTAHAGNKYVDTINPRLAVISAGTHGSDYNPRWRAISKYLGLSKNRSTRQGAGALRLRTTMDVHNLLYGTDNGWKSDWEEEHLAPNPKPSYQRQGIYSTHSSRDLCFVIDDDGNLFRKFSKTEDDGTHTLVYKIAAADGAVTFTDTKD